MCMGRWEGCIRMGVVSKRSIYMWEEGGDTVDVHVAAGEDWWQLLDQSDSYLHYHTQQRSEI